MFKKNFSIKIISVSLALFLWLFVTNNENPQDVKKLSIPISVINESSLAAKGIFLKSNSYQRNIVLNVRGRREKIKNISEADFEVTLDFSKIKDSRIKRLALEPIKYTGKEVSINEISIEYLSPLEVELSLEKIEEKSFAVELSTTGTSKENYKVVKTIITPEKVTLRGLDSLIESVISVKTLIDIMNIDRNQSVKQTCKVYNNEGREISGLTGNMNVTVDIEVAKEILLQAPTTGKPAKNYIDGDRTIVPDKILIVGNPEIINNIQFLNTETVSIENASGNVNKVCNVILPKGASIYGDNKRVNVSVEIQQLIERDINIAKEDITFTNMEIDNSLNYTIALQQISVKIKGPARQLDNLGHEDLKPSVDVAGLGEGTFKLPLKIELPDMARLVQDAVVEVKIEKR